MAPVALIVVVGVAGTMVALSAAQRTSAAYGDYLDRAEVGDVVVNPSLNTKEIDEVIRSLPGVDKVTSDSMFAVTFEEGRTQRRGDVEANETSLLVRGSPDGRYTEMDRPVVQSGRMATGPEEAVLTVEAAEAEGLRIGDVVPLSFWPPGLSEVLVGDELERYLDEEVSPIGVEHVEVVGIVTLSDEVLPDDLFPRQKMIVSPDVAARYDCLPETPAQGSTFSEVVAALLPADCAVQYRYFSLSMVDGAAGVKPALEEFLRVSQQLNAGLAEISDLEAEGVSEPPQYFLIPTETQQESRRVERSTRPTVAAFLVLGLAAASITVALAGLLVARELRRTQHDQRQWHQLGVGSWERAMVIGAPPAVAIVAGLMLGMLAGWLLAPGPFGLVQTVEPRPDHRLVGIAVLAAVGIGLAAALVVAVLAARSARRLETAAAGAGAARAVRALVGRLGSPAVADGVRAAYGPRSAVFVIAGAAVLTGAFVAATVFGTSLSSLVSTPRSYGWPWDVAAMTGSGYGDLDLARAQHAFDADPDIDTWAVLGFLNEVSLDGEPMMSVLGLERTSDVELPLLSGALPVGTDEVAIGATTAADRGLEVGDSAEIGGAFTPFSVTITGLVVFPTLGPVLADRVGTGTGMLLPEALFESGDRQYLAEAARGLATFVGIDVRDGADTPATMARLRDQLASLDLLGVPAITYQQPVRPPEIVDASSTRTVPVAVGAGFAAMAAIGLAFASWSSARSRRRDLAVLRSLGFSGAQVRSSVRTQSLATMLGALAIGVPCGVLAGRVLWRTFAHQLGVVPDPDSPWVPVLLATAGGIVLALLAAEIPARAASRSAPTEGLRAE